MCMIRTHQNKIAVAVKRDIRTVARYKDTIREWSSAKCGTARRQQTRSATAAGSPSKHSGNPRSRFFFGFVGYLFFFFGFCRLVSCRYTAKQQQSHSTPKSLKRERCKIRTFAPGSSGICQIQDIYIDIYKLRHYLSSDRQRTKRNKSVIVMDWCDYCTHAQKALCAGS